jgi:hypothetical protein
VYLIKRWSKASPTPPQALRVIQVLNSKILDATDVAEPIIAKACGVRCPRSYNLYYIISDLWNY